MKWKQDEQLWMIKNYIEQNIDNVNTIPTIRKKETLVDLNINPEQLFQQTRSIKSMNFQELNKLIIKSKEIGDEFLSTYQIEQNERFSYAFSIFIFTLFGFLIANKKDRGGLGHKLTAGLAICFLYIFLMKFSTTLTVNSGIPANITVWAPNIICLLICITTFKRLT